MMGLLVVWRNESVKPSAKTDPIQARSSGKTPDEFLFPFGSCMSIGAMGNIVIATEYDLASVLDEVLRYSSSSFSQMYL
jgi:hypothetical protein